MRGTGQFFVGGNWKCNGTKQQVAQLLEQLNKGKVDSSIEVVIAPTFIHLPHVLDTADSRFEVGAQNCWSSGTGAYTGEISAEQLADLGVKWVILGHSERRSLLKESNEFVGEKTAYALSHGLRVIACIGETLEQRESGQMYNILDAQLEALANQISDFDNVVIAYEPVWAIGTGKVATPDQAEEVHLHIREWFTERIGEKDAEALRIVYGGSVNEKNAAELAAKEDVDGFLVGGASLKADAFVTICNAHTAATPVAA
ncbi:hypothetical protein WJX73_007167 [Symbiochloris irregularis]|uniref:Triosephosphate isomerase n=1 Tax=Symbiochloris irregularis TaxID=706552 RepID=A0AAW1P4D6_9CHLO